VGEKSQRTPEGSSEPSDAELWSDARTTNPAPFGELFERHADRIFRHCRYQVDSVEEAEDLVMVVFAEAWRRRNDVAFDTGRSVLPWLLAVANNAIRNRRRSIRRHKNLLAKLPPLEIEEDHSERVAEQVDTASDGQHVLKAFRQLRATEQDVLVLCIWQGASYEDAALALGIPAGTVKSRLSRARQRLRELTEIEKRGAGRGRRMSARLSRPPQKAMER
jgi:RNA polymerase sigma factor (sigma-70 family)